MIAGVLWVVFCSVLFSFVIVSAYFGWVLLFCFLGGGMGCLEVSMGGNCLSCGILLVRSFGNDLRKVEKACSI